MTEIFLERPVVLGISGFALAAVASYFWLQTGHRRLLHLSVVCVLLTLALVLVERLVETDRESARAALFRIAAHVERNEYAEALKYIHSASAPVLEETEQALRPYQFQRVEIKKNLTVELKEGSVPQQAVATFNTVVVVAAGPASGYLERPVPMYLEVTLQMEEGEWRVLDYSVQQALRGLQKGQ